MCNEWASKELVTMATALLNGNVDVVPAIRNIVSLLMDLPPAIRSSNEVLVLIAVESETADFPIREQRQLWAPGVLLEQDEELNNYIAQTMPSIEESCYFLIENLAPKHSLPD